MNSRDLFCRSRPLPGPRHGSGQRKGRSKETGFTLIEVVVAFVLLALVLSTAFEIFSSGLARAGLLEERSRALAIAQSQLAAAGVEEALKESDFRGESEDHKYQWAVSIRRSDEGMDPAKPPPSVYSLYRIDVRVAWRGEDARDHDLALATLGIWARS
jgi:general secretion pathway protein I